MMNSEELRSLGDNAEDRELEVEYSHHHDYDEVLLNIVIDGVTLFNEDLEYDLELAREAEDCYREDHRSAHTYFYG